MNCIKFKAILDDYKMDKITAEKAMDSILGLVQEDTQPLNSCFTCRHKDRHGLSCAYCKYGSNWQEVKE